MPTNLNIFDFIYNIPLLLFDFLLLFIFLLLVKAVMIIITSRNNELRLEKGKRNLYAALFWLFLLLLSASLFSFITHFLEGPVTGENGEFPLLPNSSFPPAPEYIKIGNYYFAGPWPLKNYSSINKPAIFAIGCKKANSYDILFISKTERENLLANKQYDCWVKNCEEGEKNLYVAVFYTKSENFSPERIEEIKTDLENQNKPRCLESQ